MNPAPYQGNATVKNLVFHRGKAGSNAGPWGTAPLKMWWGMYLNDYQSGEGMHYPTVCPNEVRTSKIETRWTVTTTTPVYYTNTTTLVGGCQHLGPNYCSSDCASQADPTSCPSTTGAIQTTATAKQSATVTSSCSTKKYKLGCGGVAAVYGGKSSTTTLHNCDFKYGLSLMGSGICSMGRGTLIIKGDPVLDGHGNQMPAGSMQKDANGITYQSGYHDDLTGSLCNFERNQAYGGDNINAVGAAIFAGWRPLVDGLTDTTDITVSGCNFFRNIAHNKYVGEFKNGATIATTGGPGYKWHIKDRSSFYENLGARGNAFFDAGSAERIGNSVPGRPDIGSSYNWGQEITIEDTFMKRHGFTNPSGLFGCTNTTSNNGCTDANNEGFNAGGGLAGGQYLPTGGMAAIFNTWQDVFNNRWTAAEKSWDPTDYSWWNPAQISQFVISMDFELQYRGHMWKIVPEEGFPCKGFDQFGQGPTSANLAAGSSGVFGTYYSPNTYPQPYFENCGTPGHITKSSQDLTYGGYNPGAATPTWHGGAVYIKGGNTVLTMRRSKLHGNRARTTGGGIATTDFLWAMTGLKLFEDCEFTRNIASDGGGMKLSAVLHYPIPWPLENIQVVDPDSFVEIVNCNFTANIAKGVGGAIAFKDPESGRRSYYISPKTKVRKPECSDWLGASGPLQEQYPCPEVEMLHWGQNYMPPGTTAKYIIRGTKQTGPPSDFTGTSFTSVFAYNLAGRLGGAIGYGHHANQAPCLAPINNTINVTVQDTYFHDNRMTLYPKGQATYAPGGGVFGLDNNSRKRTATCRPSGLEGTPGFGPGPPNPWAVCTADFSRNTACPTSRAGACKVRPDKCVGPNGLYDCLTCFDACAWEYVMPQTELLPAGGSAGIATIHDDRESPRYITFTRCFIQRSVSNLNGGVLYVDQVARDAPTVRFEQSLLTDNVAFGEPAPCQM